MGIVKKASQVAATAGGLAIVVKAVFAGEWNSETGKLDKVRVLGIPVFDRRRMEARRAKRALRRAAKRAAP